jgi:imidazolonepropionase-like amidohydrolase
MHFKYLHPSILCAVLSASPVLSCGPHPDHAAPLDVPSLITANNLARPNGTTPHKKIALDNVRIFDGTCILPPSTVVIDGSYIGSDPTGAEHIDGKGGVLLPGLIDAHCHPTNITHMQELAKWGVTSGFVMACFSQELCSSLSNHAGLPSVLRSSAPASAPGSVHGNITMFATRDASLLVNSSAAVPAWVNRQLAGQDPDYFKLIAEAPGLDQAALNMLVEEAHLYGKQSVTHAATLEAYSQAILSRTDHVHHAPLNTEISAALVEMMLQQGQFSTPTLTMMRATALAGKSTSGTNFTAALATTALLHKAGVPVLAGTDANLQPGVPAMVPFGTSLHDELENLVEAGMSNIEALLAATVKPARAFGLWDRGTIQAGMRADLVLVGGDPLADIKNTRDIKRVWIGGVQVGSPQ